MAITAILVDDEQPNLENLAVLLKWHCPQVQVSGQATNVDDAVELMHTCQPDLLFLDIQMGRETGFDLLKRLPNKNFEVIFVTAYDQYGIQAVKFSALDYILKPIDILELQQAVAMAEKKITLHQQSDQLKFLLQELGRADKQPTKIALPQYTEVRYVNIADIVRCEADNTYTHFHFAGGESLLISKPLKEYADLLKPNGFLRTHQSHLVNPSFVKSWLKEDGGTLLLTNGEKIPVSKPNRETVRQALSS